MISPGLLFQLIGLTLLAGTGTKLVNLVWVKTRSVTYTALAAWATLALLVYPLFIWS